MAKRSRNASSEDDEANDSSDSDIMPSGKLVEVDKSSSDSATAPVIHCDLPPHKHPLPFTSYESYDVHYSKFHANRCSACGKNFPTNHFLNLHIEENHNSLREVLASRGEKTYGCFVEDCDRKCSTPQKRRLHLIDKHMFPKTYNFRIIDNGIDRETSLLSGGPKRRLSGFTSSPERQRIPTTPGSKNNHLKSVTETTTNKSSITTSDISDLESAMSSLQFVPTSVRMKKSKS